MNKSEIEANKKNFEKWASEHIFLLSKDKSTLADGVPIYANPMTQGAWMAWCAGQGLEPEKQKEEQTGFFTVTREWIHANTTPGGAWKAKQLAAIGVAWPPREGWMDKVHGNQISNAARLVFESFSGSHEPVVTGNAGGKDCGCDVEPWETCPHSEK